MAKLKMGHVKRGQVIMWQDDLWQIVERVHITPGKGVTCYQCKLKNLKRGKQVPQRFSPDDQVEVAHLDTREMQYLYKDGDDYVLMDNETYEQVTLTDENFGEAIQYILENDVVEVTFYEGSPISVELPVTVNLQITQCEPGVKGDTVSNVTKPATLVTGLVVQVPLFVNEGDVIKVDTRSGEYQERVNNR